jgi:hypothetical protein
MRRFDRSSALLGVLFIGLAVFYIQRDGRGTASDLGVLLPVLLIGLGLAAILRNRDRDRD